MRPSALIREAVWPADLSAAHDLLSEYFQALRDNPEVPESIRRKDRHVELSALAQAYDGRASTLLLAVCADRIVGCASVQPVPGLPHALELKRLYVRPSARGTGAGRALVRAAVACSRAHGARELLLDTLPAAMPTAVALYRSVGFEPATRYNENDASCFAFFRLALQ